MTRLLLLLLASPAFAYVSATQVVVPTYSGQVAGAMSGSVDQLRCVTFIMPFSITGATKLTWGVIGTGGTCAMGLYPDDDSGSILLGSHTACTSAGPKASGTTPSVDLTAGTPYRLCMCSSSTSTTATMSEEAASSNMQRANALNMNANRVGVAASTCNTGALPPTTGALTPSIFKTPVAVIE
jgi:hypothetical protein